MLLNLKNKEIFSLRALTTDGIYIQFKLHTQILYRKIQVKYDFGPGQMIFYRVMPPEHFFHRNVGCLRGIRGVMNYFIQLI